jgi:hypothetical protein
MINKTNHPYSRRQFISLLRKFKIKYQKIGDRIIINHPSMFGIYLSFDENYIEINQTIP